MDRVLVIGGGIVGLSSAYWLSKAGVSVVLAEQGAIPNPLASSTDHHRLIRSVYGDSAGYTRRIPDAYAAWRAMWTDLGGPEVRYYADTGMLSASQEDGDSTDRSRMAMDAAGIAYERIDGVAALSHRFPFLEAANIGYGLISEGGALMANHILTDLAWWLRGQGVTVLEHAPVTQIVPETGVVTLADGRELSADHVVVAAGVETATLLPELDLPLTPHRTMIVYAEPPAHLAAAFVNAPCWTHLGGDADLWGMAPVGPLPAKLGAGSLRRRDPEMKNRAMTIAEMELVRSQYRGRFRDADQFQIRWGQANYWTHAPDHQFYLRNEGRVMVVSACSGHGFKFGALTGRDVADVLTEVAPMDVVRARAAGLQAAA